MYESESRVSKMILTSWEKIRLDAVATVQTGIAKGKLNLKETVAVPYLRVANVQDGYIDLSEIKSIIIEKSSLNKYKLQKGDVLLTEGGDFDKLGRGAVWEGEIDPCIHQNHIFVVRPKKEFLSPEFLSLLTGSAYGKAYFLKCSKQSTNLASINSSQLKEFPVLLPSLAEQKAVVDYISIWDSAIEKIERLIVSKGTRFQWLMRCLISDNADNPNWKKVNLDKIVVREKGKVVSLNDRICGLPYIGAANFDGQYREYSDSEDAVFSSENDVLILWDGEYAGKVTTGLNGVVGSTVMKLNLIVDEVDNQYMRYHLLAYNSRIMSIREGSGVPHLPGDFLLRYEFAFPLLDQQRQIASILSLAKEEIDVLMRMMNSYRVQKNILVQKLLIAKWRVKSESDFVDK